MVYPLNRFNVIIGLIVDTIYAVERTMVIESLTLVLSVHGNVH
ncbi:hypothetical protein CAS74_004973 [Pichia kudriavzevii]|uniref:Uncharacterized protein n=1 Tax=Pichia kudriavzevii TaxID=4909 RepID=A0A1Z8JI24_PICKU|nr:hypothetical protein CAS74_004973 [Pichia kudriavzevii]